MNESDLRSDVHYLGSSENKAWKKISGLYGIWTHDLCDTGAALYQLGADQYVGSKYTIQVMNNDFRYTKFIYLHCGEETNVRDPRS